MNMQATRRTSESEESKFGAGVAKAPKVLLAETSRLPYIALFALDLAKAGCDVSFVCPVRHPVLKTQAVQQLFRYNGLRPVESLKAAIEAADPEFIIPCDDRAVGHLHELHARARLMGALGRDLVSLIEKSLGSPENYPIVASRYDFLRIAREEGLHIPDIAQVNSE